MLWALTALFCFRVVAQPLAAVASVPGLPPFDAWHSGALPYPVLLATQVAIVAWLVRTTRAVGSATIRWRRSAGAWLAAGAAVYGAAMTARLVLGATLLRDESWFARPVPTFFHLVLASYLGVYGVLHLRQG